MVLHGNRRYSFLYALLSPGSIVNQPSTNVQNLPRVVGDVIQGTQECLFHP